jgi:hypothetical protein
LKKRRTSFEEFYLHKDDRCLLDTTKQKSNTEKKNQPDFQLKKNTWSGVAVHSCDPELERLRQEHHEF